MKGRTKAQQLRLLIDKLEEAAVEAKGAVAGLPEMTGKAGDLVPKTPDGIRSLVSVLKTAYLTAKEDENAPTNEELKFLQTLEPAQQARSEARELVKKAEAAYATAIEGHEHRIRLEDPEILPGNGAAIYPHHPTCVVCGDELEFEWFCIKSPELRCLYPNVINVQVKHHFITGQHLMDANHDGDIECVHCGETWTRME